MSRRASGDQGGASQPDAPAADYDEFVNWDERLAREGPFFRRIFAERDVRSVVDVGAGSARHAILFATWGLDVAAVDPDESMLAQAVANIDRFAGEIAKGGGSVHLLRAGFGELQATAPGPFDAVICTGNALPHVSGIAGLRDALADFAAVLAPAGTLVLHLLDHHRLLTGRLRAIAPKVRDTAEGTKVFLRVIDYPDGGDTLDFDFVTLVRSPDGEWALSHRRSSHTALPAELLVRELERAGFGGIEVFGGHDRRAYEPGRDESIVVTARRNT